jgi:hypothetical protein
MTPLEAIQARKQRATIDHGWAVQAREAAQAAEREASHAMRAAKAEADDAEEWAALAKAARRRVLSAKPEDVAAFGSARSYGADEARWTGMGWRKQKADRSGWRTEYRHVDTKDGTAARILHRRGREWCESLEVTL